MTSRALLNELCLAVSGGCLAAGCALAGQWVMLPAVLIASLAWIGDRKWPHAGLSTVGLVFHVGLAGAGLWMQASPVLMIVGAACALASWDLVNFGRALTASTSAPADAHLETRHLQSLVVALGIGLLIALAGRIVLFRIPFGVVLLLVMAVLYSLDRLWRLLSN